jgi:hypothetical protein
MRSHILKLKLKTSTLTERNRNCHTAGGKRIITWNKGELLWVSCDIVCLEYVQRRESDVVKFVKCLQMSIGAEKQRNR